MQRSRTTPARPARRPSGGALLARLAALEDRVARLETGRPPPGDGRRAAVRTRSIRRCPGCGLPLRTRRGRCESCGRPLDSEPAPRSPRSP